MQIGQYVKYEPSGGSTSYSSTQAHNGSEDQIIERETLSWRVLSVGGNTVMIISEPTTKTVTYQGVEGYNNAVKDLNDMCETLYSHGDTKARSVNLDDFTTSSIEINSKQGSSSMTASSSYGKFPTIYQYEYSGSLGQSAQTQWYSGTYNIMSFKINYSSGSIPSDSPLYNSSSWLSSREVGSGASNVYGNYPAFRLKRSGKTLFYSSIYVTISGESSSSTSVRSVVTLPVSCTFGNEAGDEANPITINWPEEETGYICGRCASGDVDHEVEDTPGTCYVKNSITCSKCGHYYVDICSDTNEDVGACYDHLGFVTYPCDNCSVTKPPV